MKAYELLSSPAKWTKGYFARNNEGRRCGWSSDKASCWCMLGAINRAYHANGADTKFTIINREVIKRGYRNIAEFNDADTTTYEDVIKILKAYDV